MIFSDKKIMQSIQALQDQLIKIQAEDTVFKKIEQLEDKLNPSNNLQEVLNLRKRVAYLEGLNDYREHRKPTEMVMQCLIDLSDKMLALDRQGENTREIAIKINTLKWVLGKEQNV